MYDAVGEYARMGIPNQYWTMSDLNDNYEVGVAHCSGRGLMMLICCSSVSHILVTCAFLRQPVMKWYVAVQSFGLKEDYQPSLTTTRPMM